MFPVVLRIAGFPCLVVGGGGVAERKTLSLLESGARVSVIAPRLTPGLEALNKKGLIRHVRRPYREGDVFGYRLVIAATDSAEANRAVYRDAEAGGILVNSVDDPAHSSFFIPSILRRGRLLVAVSTSGTVPALARALRLCIQEQLYEGIEQDMDKLAIERQSAIREAGADRQLKDKLFQDRVQPEIEKMVKRIKIRS